MTKKIAGAFGRVHTLFNCIGVYLNTDAHDIPAEEWAQVMSVNVNGELYIAQAVARHMAEHDGGAIVAIGSNSGS